MAFAFPPAGGRIQDPAQRRLADVRTQLRQCVRRDKT